MGIQRVEVNTVEIVKRSFPKLMKDLQENERICEKCMGLGMVAVDNVFGLEGDTSKQAKEKVFPYKEQAFTYCDKCYNGVQKLCKHCGRVFDKCSYVCDCDGYRMEQEENERKKWEEVISKAKEVSIKDVENMLYCEENKKYYMGLEEFISDWRESNKGNDVNRPNRLWVTEKVDISIDACSVAEDACSELHEDAYDSCDTGKLQGLLNIWCEQQTGTTTYYADYKEYVAINWD